MHFSAELAVDLRDVFVFLERNDPVRRVEGEGEVVEGEVEVVGGEVETIDRAFVFDGQEVVDLVAQLAGETEERRSLLTLVIVAEFTNVSLAVEGREIWNWPLYVRLCVRGIVGLPLRLFDHLVDLTDPTSFFLIRATRLHDGTHVHRLCSVLPGCQAVLVDRGVGCGLSCDVCIQCRFTEGRSD